MAFSVVHFLNTDEVSVVNSAWISPDNDICKWPPVKDAMKLKRAILEHHKPTEEWPEYEIVVMGKYDNYVIAKRKSDLALETSTLETDQEDEPPLKQKKCRNSRCSSSDSEGDETRRYKSRTALPSPPPVCQPMITNGIETSCIQNVQLLQSAPAYVALETALSKAEPSEWEREILNKLNDIQRTLGMLTTFVRGNQPDVSNITDVANSLPKLPVDSAEELTDWESYLNDASSFSNAVKFFGCKVGADGSQSTRRLLCEIITNRFAQEYNWGGRPPKKSFKGLKTVSLILCAVKENPLTRDIPGKVIEDTIKDWLKHAAFRAKYVPKKFCELNM